jgi:hypothetical protein
MRFLADESCDFRVVRALRAAGRDVKAIIEAARKTKQSSRWCFCAFPRRHAPLRLQHRWSSSQSMKRASPHDLSSSSRDGFASVAGHEITLLEPSSCLILRS